MDFLPVPNGIDYLSEVVTRLARPAEEVSPRDLKYAVLHLQAATEVLIKARLQIDHWSLVVKDLSKCTKEKYDRGEFDSATVAESMRRLADMVGIPVRKDDREAVEELAKLRNRLQHWGLQETVALVEKRAASVLDFLMRFVDEHLTPALGSEQRAALREEMDFVRRGVRDIGTYVEARRTRLHNELKEYADTTVQCPSCHEWALVVDRTDSKCHFCPRSWDSEPLAHAYEESFESGGIDDEVSSGDCPECWSRTLIVGVRTAAAQDQPIDMCFSCAKVFTGLRLCSCLEYFVPVAEEDICRRCLDRYMEMSGME
ncbi:hypothetical protein EF919_03295 [Streptomyces sp. WAC02707]|uniref:hypothetical protein n=1 Tax=Streptomyces sp. WAC02707 TaxID=2487417 RepID=UPI000F788453|nr:hypothetical protein [Streptomyces sp. WAC02707]RSS97486.1 hypothetical protein EF919_03295 [Streptomyces sp. WAC02707]